MLSVCLFASSLAWPFGRTVRPSYMNAWTCSTISTLIFIDYLDCAAQIQRIFVFELLTFGSVNPVKRKLYDLD